MMAKLMRPTTPFTKSDGSFLAGACDLLAGARDAIGAAGDGEAVRGGRGPDCGAPHDGQNAAPSDTTLPHAEQNLGLGPAGPETSGGRNHWSRTASSSTGRPPPWPA